MAAVVHRPLKIIAYNANYIWRQRYKLSKQLQDKYHWGYLSQIITFIGLTASQGEKA
jgi:hypothetical protein